MENENNPSTPIESQFLNDLRDELSNLFTVKHKTKYQVTMLVRSPFTLGLLVGSIMNRFVRDGISWHKMVVNIKELSVQLSVSDQQQTNLLQMEWL